MQTNQEIASDVFQKVLEEQAFLFSDPIHPEETAPAAGPLLHARMRFSGPIVGALDLVLPRSMAHQIAAGVLGLDEDDEMVAENAEDSVKELLNVICGNILTSLAGVEPVFDLSVPEIAPMELKEWHALIGDPAVVVLDVEGSAALLRLQVET